LPKRLTRKGELKENRKGNGDTRPRGPSDVDRNKEPPIPGGKGYLKVRRKSSILKITEIARFLRGGRRIPERESLTGLKRAATSIKERKLTKKKEEEGNIC